jgi:hypothetical protein
MNVLEKGREGIYQETKPNPRLRVVGERYVIISPAGPGIKNKCACEGHQKLTRPTDTLNIPNSTLFSSVVIIILTN